MRRIDANQPIASLAAEVPGAMSVFESLGIDYSCAGNLSLDDAAHAEGVDTRLILDRLQLLRPTTALEPWKERPLTELVRHLVHSHHGFVRDSLATIALRLADLAAAPRNASPELLALQRAVSKLGDAVLPHMSREEHELFHRVEILENEFQPGQRERAVDELQAQIRTCMFEHATIASQLRTIRTLRLRNAASAETSAAVLRVLDSIARLESHLHECLFLENSVLFPRAIALESAGGGRTAPDSGPV